MRFSTIRTSAVAGAAAIALAACANHGVVPTSPTAYNPMTSGAGFEPLAKKTKLTTCATNPPQPQWIFKGACQKATINAKGATVTLGLYKKITVQGLIGPTTATKKTAFTVVDAKDNGDIKAYKGKAFPKYKGAQGTVILYFQAVNGGKQVIKLKTPPANHVAYEFLIKSTGTLPGKACSVAYLLKTAKGLKWTATPITDPIKNGNTVAVESATIPKGFEFPVGPLFLAFNCHS